MARSATSPAPVEKGNASQLIRERLLSGEPFAVPQLADEFGVTKGLVTSVLMKFRQDGYDVNSVSRPFNGRRMKHYFVKERVEEPAFNGSSELSSPALGQMLVVALLALGPEGELRIGLRDDASDTTYVCTLEGSR